MTAYEIIQQHPEWVTSERVPRAAIQERAKRYVSDYKGNGNFAKGVTEDLDDLLRRRDATNDFAGIVADGDTPQVNTESPEYLADKRKAKICAIFVEAVISELAGRSICTAAQIQEWRERYGVKLEGLQGKTEQITKVVRELKPIADIKAEKIYMSLKNWEYIDCGEDIFLWHFGERKHRKEMQAPAIVEWKKNLQYVFAYCCNRISNITEPGNDTNWKALEQHIKPNPNMRWDWKKANGRLKDAKKVLKTNKELLRLENLFDEVKKMDEEKANPELKNETADTYNNFLKSLEQELKFKK